MRVSRMAGLPALLAATLLLGACGSDDGDTGSTGDDGDAPATTAIEVVAQDFSYDQPTLDVDPGAEVTVTLTNEDDAEHTFTIEELDVEAEAQGGETAEATFTAPDSGIYQFFCEYHPDQMRGIISIGGDTETGGSPEDSKDKSEDDGGNTNPKY